MLCYLLDVIAVMLLSIADYVVFESLMSCVDYEVEDINPSSRSKGTWKEVVDTHTHTHTHSPF